MSNEIESYGQIDRHARNILSSFKTMQNILFWESSANSVDLNFRNLNWEFVILFSSKYFDTRLSSTFWSPVKKPGESDVFW